MRSVSQPTFDSSDSTLKAGIWKVKILNNNKSVAKTKFAIFPDNTGNENLAFESVSKLYSVGKSDISAFNDFVVRMEFAKLCTIEVEYNVPRHKTRYICP